MPTIAKVHPKGQDIRISTDGHTYLNDAFRLQFQAGEVDEHGVRNGVFDEELVAVLIDRAIRRNDSAQAELLRQVLVSMMPEAPLAEPTVVDSPLADDDE